MRRKSWRKEEVLKILKKAGYKLEDIIIGFFDASSPQLSPNTARLWSFKKTKIRRITTRQRKRANTFGFYTLNGNNVVTFQERSKKENVIEVLRMIKEENGEKNHCVLIISQVIGRRLCRKRQKNSGYISFSFLLTPLT